MSQSSIRYASKDIPQAPNLGRIRSVVQAILAGQMQVEVISAATSVTPRHVAYAICAAQTLALLDVDGAPTALARRLAATTPNGEDERIILRRCIEDSAIIRAIAPGLLSANPPTKNAIALRIQRATDLGDSTAEHRAGDILAWSTQLLQPRLHLAAPPGGSASNPLPSAGGGAIPAIQRPRRDTSRKDHGAIEVHVISDAERARLLERDEGHFLDFKAKAIAPGKLTRTLAAFANADGGELLIGIAEGASDDWVWDGFANEEAANGHVQCFDSVFALGQGFSLAFLKVRGVTGLVLHVLIQKTRDIKRATDAVPYLRRGAQNIPVITPEALRNLERTKGVVSFEDERVPSARVVDVANSHPVLAFMLEVIPNSEPEPWLRKQQLLADQAPTVAGLLLFAEEPQVFLPKAAVKIYRYSSSEREGTRESLVFDPITIEGPLYDLISKSVSRTVELTEKIQIVTDDGLRAIQYPHESLHEIITNGLLHRDYALNDDVHVRIFDNRIEVESPGRLPAHITPSNILQERFARNPKIVRIINKFPNPPNKDVGEGLNTAFRAMKKLRLREPQITERENSVLVTLLHEKLASPEQQIIDFTRDNGTINNAQARTATGIESEIKVRGLLQKLVRVGELEQVPGTSRGTSAYRMPPGKR